MRMPSGLKLKAKNTRQVRFEANIAREQILGVVKVGSIAEVAPDKLLEHLDEFGIEVQVIEKDSQEIGEDVPAAMVGHVLKIRDPIYKGMCDKEPRDVFTLYHELGHHFLKHERSMNRGQFEEHMWIEDSEWQANTFASEILMPLDEIKANRYTSIFDLVDAYGVSCDAARIRLEKLRQQGEI